MVKRVYVDNSVIGGIHDSEFSDSTERLFREFRIGLYVPVISNVTFEEIKDAPAEVLKSFQRLSSLSEIVEVNDEAVQLSASYMKEGRFTKRMLTDTLHIAIASVHRVDILVSWNFRDIVNLNKIVIYNAVNLKLGYPQIEIRNPREIIHE